MRSVVLHGELIFAVTGAATALIAFLLRAEDVPRQTAGRILAVLAGCFLAPTAALIVVGGALDVLQVGWHPAFLAFRLIGLLAGVVSVFVGFGLAGHAVFVAGALSSRRAKLALASSVVAVLMGPLATYVSLFGLLR